MKAPAASGGGRRRPPALAEINVTPLVDVMLVLLIISMLAAPMLEKGIRIDLPVAESATDVEDARVVVSVDRQGRIRINDRPIHADLLEGRMKEIARASPGEVVYLRADKLLPYGDVLRVMDRIRRAGVGRVALVTVPLEPVAEQRR